MMSAGPPIVPPPNGTKRRRLTRSVLLWFVFSAFPLFSQFLLLKSRTPFGQPIDDSPHIVTVGVAVTITGCSDFPLDGAAVLQYSIRNATSRYRYKFYAIYHPSASSCAQSLSSIGYTLLERETPVNVSGIEGKNLRGRIEKSGCCGEKELIKLEAFQLIEHPVVLLLDMDTLVLKPLDDVFDLILHNQRPVEDHHLMWPEREIPNDIWLLYTNDYAMARPSSPIKPSQGGFSILKPNRTIYEEFRAIVRKGDFDGNSGWGGRTGIFWGSTTYQGLLPYYFQILNPGHAVELNNCRHNNMNANPLDSVEKGVCSTNQSHCEDCRARRLEEVYSVHFTNCLKPWECLKHGGKNKLQQLCRGMHGAWYQIRSEMEKSWGRSGLGNGTGDYALKFYGYCHEYNASGYEPIRQPYGLL